MKKPRPTNSRLLKLTSRLSPKSRQFIKHQRSKMPLLSSLDVRNFLQTLGIEAKVIALIGKHKKFRWIIRGKYQGKDKAIFTLDFYAYQLCQHAHSPQGIPACSHSVISLKCGEFSVKEFGGEIKLIEKNEQN